MAFEISKLAGKDLESYSPQHKFCKFGSHSCSLEGKFGFVSFDFSGFKDAKSCRLKFKRISGNGLVAIVSDNEATNYNVVSKVFENITVDLSETKKFNILRPSSGIGNIELLSVSLLSEEPTETADVDLKNELKKCKRKFVRVVGNRVFANEGSSLRAGDMPIYVETEPPNMYRSEDNVIKFSGLCEIVKLKVNSPSPHEFPKFLEPARKASSLTPAGDRVSSGFENILEHSLVFDFKPDRDSAQSTDAGVLPGGMNMGRYGDIKIPDISLENGGKYVLVLEGKNMDGNGRITISVSGTDLNKSVYIGADESMNVPFKAIDDGPYVLDISRSGPSRGNVWISRVFISKDEAIHSHLKNNKELVIDPIVMKEIGREKSVDNFRYDILNFSKFNAETYGKSFAEIKLNLKPCTYSMHSWVAKFANLFDGVTVDSCQIKNCTLKESHPDKSILLTDVRNLMKYRKIMLEEFNAILNQQQVEILQNADVIFTPSLVNAQYLRSIDGIDRVFHVPKYWAFKPPSTRKVSEKYNLLISRSISNTTHFVDKYNSDKKLVVLGYRGKKLNAETFNEFLPYSDVLSLIYHADCIIDFPENIHYYSGLLDFALTAKKDIVTTNNWLSICKPPAHVIKTGLAGKHLVPSYLEAVLATHKTGNKAPNTDMNSYNNNIKSSLMIMSEG